MRLLCYMSAQSKPHEFENPFSLRQSAVSRTGLRDLPPGNLDHHSIAAKRGFRERARRSVCCWGTTHIDYHYRTSAARPASKIGAGVVRVTD